MINYIKQVYTDPNIWLLVRLLEINYCFGWATLAVVFSVKLCYVIFVYEKTHKLSVSQLIRIP